MKKLTTALIALTFMAGTATAGSWTLDADTSRIAFGSVKKNTLGEVHHFESISGSVSEEGAVVIEIDLNSVQTNIDIRNERMIEHVFKAAPAATLSAQVNMAALNALPAGGWMVSEVDATLALAGTEAELYTDMFIMRLTEDSVMVTTNDMIFLDTEEAGIDGGIDALKALAELSGITRAAPVTLRLMFSQN